MTDIIKAADQHDARPEEAYKVAFDLSTCHEVYVKGSVTLWMTWNRVSGEPCMVLTPNDPHLSHERIIPCVIPMRTSWQWDETRGDPEFANMQAFRFCDALRFNPYNVRNIVKLQSLIRDHLEDLVRMPPMPDDGQQITASAIITDNATGKETFKEIRDHA